MAKKSDGAMTAFEALENAGFDVNNRATGTRPQMIPTGFVDFDMNVLRCGGIPRQRYTQIYGEPAAGKTLLAMRIVAMAQRDDPDRIVLYIDSEHTFDSDWAVQNGVDMNKLFLVQSNTAEHVYEQIIGMVKTGVIGLVIIDTVGNLIEAKAKHHKVFADADADKKAVKRQPGAFAKLTKQFAQVLLDEMVEHNIAVVGLNHITSKIGVLFGPTEDQPGGRNWKFNLTLDLSIRNAGVIKDGEKGPIEGIVVAVSVMKNKFASKAKTTDTNHLTFFFDNGIERADVYGLVDRALRVDVIKLSGNSSWLECVWNGEKIGKWQGRDNARKAFMNDKALRERVQKIVTAQEKFYAQSNSGVPDKVAPDAKGDGVLSEEED